MVNGEWDRSTWAKMIRVIRVTDSLKKNQQLNELLIF